jgi:hypothetical protein
MKYRIRVISDYATCWGIVEADTEAAARQRFDAGEWTRGTDSWDVDSGELKIAEIEEGSR